MAQTIERGNMKDSLLFMNREVPKHIIVIIIHRIQLSLIRLHSSPLSQICNLFSSARTLSSRRTSLYPPNTMPPRLDACKYSLFL